MIVLQNDVSLVYREQLLVDSVPIINCNGGPCIRLEGTAPRVTIEVNKAYCSPAALPAGQRTVASSSRAVCVLFGSGPPSLLGPVPRTGSWFFS